MIKHVCADCGAKFHMTESFLEHVCVDRCDGDCGHCCDPSEGTPCRLCTSLNPDVVCLDCLADWAPFIEPTA